MADVLSPFVYWGQNSKNISLKINLRDVSDAQVDLKEDYLDFKASGTGAGGPNVYGFRLEFYLPINPANSKYRITDQGVDFQIEKVGIDECWPRLTVEQKRPAWLKIDFDRFSYEDESDENRADADAMEEEMNKATLAELEKSLKEPDKPAFDISFNYLFFYNMFQWVGFSFIFGTMLYAYTKDGEQAKSEAYDKVGGQLMICQLIAILEIIHPILGIVKTGVLAPTIQVFGRNMVLFFVVAQDKRAQALPIVWWLFMVWSAVEIIRYPFYMLSSIKLELGVITWLRYTLWIPLYPLGFMLEALTMLSALPMYEETGKNSVELPNRWNFSFDFPMFLKFYLCCFVPGSLMLLKHMYKLRVKKLGSGVVLRSKEKTS